jgi:serine/threonine protein kinase
MGEVYEASADDLSRRVAVKRMIEANGTDEDLKLLFLREVAVAATLEHHHVVEVLDAGECNGELFLVMELVDGPSLAEVVEVLRQQGKILPIEITCGIVSHVALGLGHAHERAFPDGSPMGIVHRDVALENVLIGQDGVPKVVDFGLAKVSGHSLTEPGIVRGRPRSLAPEQARGDRVDARADIFSLGTILFELAAGQALYPNEQVVTLLWKVAAGDYGALEPRLAHIDPDLVEIIRGMLAVDPAHRFRSAREVERALDAFRAARGMRVSSRAVAQVVGLTWPAIQELRRERMQGETGELEGMTLTLAPDAFGRDGPSRGTPTERSGPRSNGAGLADRGEAPAPRSAPGIRPTSAPGAQPEARSPRPGSGSHSATEGLELAPPEPLAAERTGADAARRPTSAPALPAQVASGLNAPAGIFDFDVAPPPAPRPTAEPRARSVPRAIESAARVPVEAPASWPLYALGAVALAALLFLAARSLGS